MRRALVPLPLAGALALAACGSSNDNGTTSSSATPQPAAGETVKLVMKNPSSAGKSHGIAVEGNGVDKDGKIVSPGETSTLTVTLKPGKYEFYCPVPSHKAAGMKGTLTVS